MNILAFCTTFWDDDPKLAEAKGPELAAWHSRVMRDLDCDALGVFLATGCCDNWDLNPLLELRVPMLKSFEPRTKPYDVFRWSYFLCAFESALWNALHCGLPWDLLVELESNCWINPKVNLSDLLTEFPARPELILAPAWCEQPDFNFLVMKPAAVPAFLHHRRRANLVDDDQPMPMLAEAELGQIFKGRWWNPWPEIQSIRQGYQVPGWAMPSNEVAKDWPCVALPSPEIQKLFSL